MRIGLLCHVFHHVFSVCGRAFLHPISLCCRPHTLELAGGLALATVCEALPGASRTPRSNLGNASLAQTATDTTPGVHPGRPSGSYEHMPTWRASPRTSSLPTHPVLCQPAPPSAPLLGIPCTTGPPPPQTSSRLPCPLSPWRLSLLSPLPRLPGLWRPQQRAHGGKAVALSPPLPPPFPARRCRRRRHLCAGRG